MATTDRWIDSTGEKKERTVWHRVVFWDRLGETVAKTVRKGSLVEVEGSNLSSTYEKDGVTRTSCEVRGSEFRVFPTSDVPPPGAPEEPPLSSGDIPL